MIVLELPIVYSSEQTVDRELYYQMQEHLVIQMKPLSVSLFYFNIYILFIQVFLLYFELKIL